LDTTEAVAAALEGIDFSDLDDILNATPVEAIESEDDETLEGEEGESYLVEEESEEDQQAEETEESDATVIDVDPSAKLRLPDGTLIDANNAILMQADYTRKTQELAEQRKQFEQERDRFASEADSVVRENQQMRAWYESRASSPSEWIAEIASQSQDPTSTVARSLYELATAGVLDKQFVETFGIETGDVAEIAKSSKIETELQEMKAWRAQQEAEVKRQSEIQQRTKVYEQEWERIKAADSLMFNDVVEESEAKKQLLMFAIENNLGRSLVDAYDIMKVRRGPLVKERATTPDPAVVTKKRASRAVTPKTAVTGTVPRRRELSTRDAILEAMEGITV